MKEGVLGILKEYWGHQEFKGSQQHIIENVLAGRDVLALLPTGGGKSVCFQVPALATEGICIVISPLIALIKDQVDQLKARGIKAVGLSGGISFEETQNILDNCLFGGYKFLYLSPEKLQQEVVQDRISQMKVNMIAIDEAHCISQWGIDFRPAYLKCSVLRELHPEVPCIALTATATEKVASDILQNLQLKSPLIIKDSFLRENLIYKVAQREDKHQYLLQLCRKDKNSAIVYVRSRRKSLELSKFLNDNGIKADYFHGGIPTREKAKKLQAWLNNKQRVMVATNAFGMGIDKADVARVIHFEIPDSIENYFQEAGRAGRNGARAEAVLLTGPADAARLQNQFIEILPDVEFVKSLYRHLNNYFQIPFGNLSEENYPFNFNLFCQTYKLNTALTYNGLRLLDQNSVIALSQNFSEKTTVKFVGSKHSIFSYLDAHPKEANILQCILRTYGGVFEFETRINTLLIAKKSGSSEEAVLSTLQRGQTDGILEFKGEPQDMEITFLVPREDERTIHVFAHKIRELNQLKIANVEAILKYSNNNKVCRSRQLLGYFNEKTSKNCQECDVCLSKIKTDSKTLVALDQEIIAILQKKAVNSASLISALGRDRKIVLQELQYLLEDGKIRITSNNEYTIP